MDRPRVYFYFPTGSISHFSGCLMQGFGEMGFHVVGNIDGKVIDSRGISSPYSRTGGITGVGSNERGWTDALFSVVDLSHGLGENVAVINEIISTGKACFVDMKDSANTDYFSPSVVTFVAHRNKLAGHTGSYCPIAFGLSNDIIDLSSRYTSWKKDIFFIKNFNPTAKQDVRLSLDLCLVDNLRNFFEVDSRSTSGEEYAEHLSKAAFVLAYGGTFFADFVKFSAFEGKLPREFLFDRFATDVAIFRWDSWRFWEAMVFGCIPLQLDFEKYGMDLPVLPKPWVHYIPIDLSTVSFLPQQIHERFKKDPEGLLQIGRNARQFAIEHYSPRAAATRAFNALVQGVPVA